MLIRRATLNDFKKLYALGKKTPELQVSATEVFMDEDEFRWAIKNRRGVFLLAENDRELQGFIYASSHDVERTALPHKWSCLVYLAVAKNFRGRGVATVLYEECLKRLRRRGITHLYAWVRTEHHNGVENFMKKQGFSEGHRYMWMDRKIA